MGGRKLTLDEEDEVAFGETLAARQRVRRCPATAPEDAWDDPAAADTLNPIHPAVGLTNTLQQLATVAGRLVWWLGVPTKWGWAFARMVLFVLAMLPALLPIFAHYCMSPYVKKNLAYGASMRQMLDVYLPIPEAKGGHGVPLAPGAGHPVVVFVTGGAWIIGYKAWGFIWGMILQRHGVLVLVPDYRNFPQVSLPGMVSDVSLALSWVASHVEQLGGDVNNITLVGQSAGAHITLLMLLQSIALTAREQGEPQPAAHLLSPTQSLRRADSLTTMSAAEGGGCAQQLPRLRRWVGVSGPYDIVKMQPILQARGLPARFVETLFGQDQAAHSPMHVAQDMLSTRRHAVDADAAALASRSVALLPEICLFHGCADRTVPCQQTQDLGHLLRSVGASVVLEKCYPGKSHTDPILEDTVSGNDELLPELMRLVHTDGAAPAVVDMPQLLPTPLLRLARFANPF